MTKKWEEDLLELLRKYEGRLPDVAVISIVSNLLAKQRTQLLARVREELEGVCEKHTEDIEIRIGLGGCEGCQAIQDRLKKLEIISEEVK